MTDITRDHTQIDRAAQQFKALGDPTRLRMLNLLRHGELCVCDLMAVLALPQSTASRHLAYLRNAGWLTARRQNKWMYYRLDPGVVDSGLFTAVLALLDGQHLEKDNQALNTHLATKNQHSC
jgi:ArsR family transcriptional regulator, arsenate/arsenite/antimonite-responsive transcriptional repressor